MKAEEIVVPVVAADVYITVTQVDGNKIKISCDPPLLEISSNVEEYVILRFELETVGYKFSPTAAILFKDANTQFPLVSHTNKAGRIVKLFDYNTDEDRGSYSYEVSIVGYSSDKTEYEGGQLPRIVHR